jgi:hypothetical protein
MTTTVKTTRSTAAPDARMPGAAFGFPVPDMMMMGGWLSNAQALQLEWTSFVARRMEHDRRAMQRFARCRDLMEAAKVHQDWFSEAVLEYFEEGRRVAALAAEPTGAASTPKLRTVKVAAVA